MKSWENVFYTVKKCYTVHILVVAFIVTYYNIVFIITPFCVDSHVHYP